MKNNNIHKRFGLCGHPVSHSLSPALFTAAYPRSAFSYELIPASEPREAIRLFWKGGFTGINVTAPLKSSILLHTHRQTPECTAIGACNLIIKEGDVLVAHNTDFLGVLHSLQEAKVSLKNTKCLLIGAGGAAKAAAYALLQSGATLLWANRTPAHIPGFFQGTLVTILPLHQAVDYLPSCSLIINTLPLSVPDTERFVFHLRHTVFDASYDARPLEKQAQQAGAKYIGGERWLLHQAIPSFTAMTGMSPDVSAIKFAFIQINPYFSQNILNIP